MVSVHLIRTRTSTGCFGARRELMDAEAGTPRRRTRTPCNGDRGYEEKHHSIELPDPIRHPTSAWSRRTENKDPQSVIADQPRCRSTSGKRTCALDDPRAAQAS